MKVSETSISLAFGISSPAPTAQPVYAFLPVREYGLRFMVQGDWVVPSSRSAAPPRCWQMQHLPHSHAHWQPAQHVA